MGNGVIAGMMMTLVAVAVGVAAVAGAYALAKQALQDDLENEPT